MRRFYVFHYIPDILLPLHVFAVGRRQCCGARWWTPHLQPCAETSKRRDAGDDEDHGCKEGGSREAVAESGPPDDPSFPPGASAPPWLADLSHQDLDVSPRILSRPAGSGKRNANDR